MDMSYRWRSINNLLDVEKYHSFHIPKFPTNFLKMTQHSKANYDIITHDLFCKLKESMRGLRFPDLESLTFAVTRRIRERC